MNTILLAGNLTDEPELRYTGSGTAVANASIATNERYKDQEGELQEEATFHDIVVWGNQAEVMSEYADKGQFLVIRGTVQTNEWEDNDGNTRRDKEVKVLEFDFGPRVNVDASGGSSQSSSRQEQPAGQDKEDTFEPDDDLPF